MVSKAWRKRMSFRMEQNARAASTPGVPVPGTGAFRSRGGRKRKMAAYSRPRNGGGRNHRGYEGWRTGLTGPLE